VQATALGCTLLPASGLIHTAGAAVHPNFHCHCSASGACCHAAMNVFNLLTCVVLSTSSEDPASSTACMEKGRHQVVSLQLCMGGRW
jgi:hypothetical protein